MTLAPIVALAPRDSLFCLADHLQTTGAEVRDLVAPLSYEEAFSADALPVRAYLFMALDQITPTERVLILRAREALAAASPSTVRLNDPLQWRSRLELFRAAFDAGDNSFRATRATEQDRHRRFPVFLRSEPEHTGAISPLVFSTAALTRELMLALVRGYRLRDLLIVEYSDTAVDGVFTKYAAVKLGSRILPRAVTFSRGWVTKFDGDDFDPQHADADLHYVETNPHDTWLRHMFRLGGVEYGRIDYALRNGKPQVWEINTNPTIGPNLARRRSTAETAPAAMGLGDDKAFLRERANRLFIERFSAAVKDLGAETRDGLEADRIDAKSTVSIDVTPEERRCLERERASRANVFAHRTAIASLAAPIRSVFRRVRRVAKVRG